MPANRPSGKRPSKPAVKAPSLSRGPLERLGRASGKSVDPVHWHDHAQRYKFAASVIPSDARVLDVASGSGYGSVMLSRNGGAHRTIIGVDISDEALAEASNRNVQVVKARAEALPFQNHVFGAVVSFETIEHLKDPKTFVAEAKRVLAPGGVFIVSTPVKEFSSPFSSRAQNPFHEHEFRFSGFANILQRNFGEVEFYGQHVQSSGRAYWKAFGVPFFRLLHARRIARRILPARVSNAFTKKAKGSAADSAVEKISARGPRPIYVIAVCRKPRGQ